MPVCDPISTAWPAPNPMHGVKFPPMETVMHRRTITSPATARALQTASMLLVLAAALGALAQMGSATMVSAGSAVQQPAAVPSARPVDQPRRRCNIADLENPMKLARIICQPWRT